MTRDEIRLELVKLLVGMPPVVKDAITLPAPGTTFDLAKCREDRRVELLRRVDELEAIVRPPCDDQWLPLESVNGTRSPVVHHKTRVAAFLRLNGPATRGDIIAATGTPVGSLSEVLGDEALFEQVRHGLWKAKEMDPEASMVSGG